MDIEQFKREFIARGELPPEDLLAAYNSGLRPSQIITQRQLDSLLIPTPNQSDPGTSGYAGGGGKPFLPRLIRFIAVSATLLVILTIALYAFQPTRPLAYKMVAAIVQPHLLPGSERAYIRTKVPSGYAGDIENAAKSLRGAPSSWERMSEKQRSALASIHLGLHSAGNGYDPIWDSRDGKYLRAAIPSYLGYFAKNDPVYSGLLAEYHQSWAGGNDLDAASLALQHGSSDGMPAGRAKFTNWLNLKAVQGIQANRARKQAKS